MKRWVLTRCMESIARDESGLSTTRFLESLVRAGTLKRSEIDEHFFEAERRVWIEPEGVYLREDLARGVVLPLNAPIVRRRVA